MAIGTTLPPRAYTREILTAAFNWLQTQPESVRAKATTPDLLVGLYTRAQRFGTAAEAEAPVSSQNFMSDLKNLAEGLKAFEGTKVQFSAAEAAIAGPVLQPTQAAPTTAQPAQAAPQAPKVTASVAVPSAVLGGLNEKAAAMLQEVQMALNLSSETEAANMMIALAYKSLLKTTLLT